MFDNFWQLHILFIELWEDDKSFLKNKNNSSLNDFYKHEILKTVDENTNSDELGVGSVVEVLVGDEPRYGVIKWIGSVIYGDLPTKPKIVGVEMVNNSPMRFFLSQIKFQINCFISIN